MGLGKDILKTGAEIAYELLIEDKIIDQFDNKRKYKRFINEKSAELNDNDNKSIEKITEDIKAIIEHPNSEYVIIDYAIMINIHSSSGELYFILSKKWMNEKVKLKIKRHDQSALEYNVENITVAAFSVEEKWDYYRTLYAINGDLTRFYANLISEINSAFKHNFLRQKRPEIKKKPRLVHSQKRLSYIR